MCPSRGWLTRYESPDIIIITEMLFVYQQRGCPCRKPRCPFAVLMKPAYVFGVIVPLVVAATFIGVYKKRISYSFAATGQCTHTLYKRRLSHLDDPVVGRLFSACVEGDRTVGRVDDGVALGPRTSGGTTDRTSRLSTAASSRRTTLESASRRATPTTEYVYATRPPPVSVAEPSRRTKLQGASRRAASTTEYVYPTRPPPVSAAASSARARRPRLLCMVFTMPGNWATKGTAVRETWASRCDVTLFFYSREAGHIDGATALDVPEGRAHLTAKTMTALRLSVSAHGAATDWYLKADDDTYVVVENLRALLARFDPATAHYIGGRSMDLLRTGYNGGGAGYVLSAAAARLVVERGDGAGCRRDGAIEDLDMGDCLARLGVFPIDTRDQRRRLVFHPDHPLKLLTGDRSALSVYTYSVGNHTFGNARVSLQCSAQVFKRAG